VLSPEAINVPQPRNTRQLSCYPTGWAFSARQPPINPKRLMTFLVFFQILGLNQVEIPIIRKRIQFFVNTIEGLVAVVGS
jgi:hypothetical protein